MKKIYNSIFMICAGVALSFTLSGQNLLLNPSFESGILAPWVAGNGNTVNIIDDAQDGDWAAQGNIEQIVQLEAGVKYTWTCQAKCLGGCDKNIWIGIKDLVADVLVTNFLINEYSDYTEAKIEFEASSTGDHRFWVWGLADTDYVSDNHLLLKEGTSNTSEAELEARKINIFSDGNDVVVKMEDSINEATINIHNLAGQMIYSTDASYGTTFISKDEFSVTGMYVVSVQTDKTQKVGKVLITK